MGRHSRLLKNTIRKIFLKPALLRAYLIPSVSSLSIALGLKLLFLLGFISILSVKREMIIPRKLRLFIRKHIPSPNCAIKKPAIAGPTSLEVLTIIEFRATALERCSFCTSRSERIECRKGVSKATIMPFMTESRMINQTVMVLVSVSIAKSSALDIITVWVMSITFFRFSLSAYTPAKGVTSSDGI